MELNQELKQKIVDEINSPDEEQPESNISLFTMANMSELEPFLKELTPLEMFDKSVAINQTTLANMAEILPKLSKKNIIRLFFATLKLPEKDASLKFGGSQHDQNLCAMAYANSQMARNSLVHVLGTTAIAQARLIKKRESEEKKEQESAQAGNNEGESNE